MTRTLGPWPYRTPVEAIAHLLPPTHFLRNPIPARFRVPLDSDPETLLRQLDDLPNWPKVDISNHCFPDVYPPAAPLIDAESLCTVYTTGENAVFEWLGDAVIEAAQAVCTYHLTSIPGVCRTPGVRVVAALVAKPFLAHLSLLYGLQLHDYVSPKLVGDTMPGMERMCDIFESYVGAAALHCGFQETIDWLELLLRPWAAALCSAGEFKVPKVQGKYDARIRSFAGDKVAPLDSLAVQPVFPGAPAITLSVASRESVRELLARDIPKWYAIDASRVRFPHVYPPPFPALATVHIDPLTEALTDILCRIHFGQNDEGIRSNERYRAVGGRLYALALTKVAIEQLPTATPAELDAVRVECINKDLVVRLGLLLHLDRHLRLLRTVGDTSTSLSHTQCADAFYALVGMIHLQTGWSELNAWLDELLSPWVLAAADGTFRASISAANARAVVHERQMAAQERRAEEKRQAEEKRLAAETRQAQNVRDGALTLASRARYSTTVPTAKHVTGRHAAHPTSVLTCDRPQKKRKRHHIGSRVKGRTGLLVVDPV
ncbi:hypothetical protein B0H11DRAFT_2238967 [Mycena galericulata]|nr:hypothetical protein B0H11DRAFT_2238967 [Mycena galericulata]